MNTDPAYVTRRTAAVARLNDKLPGMIADRDRHRHGSPAYRRADSLVVRTANAASRAEIDAERGYPLDTRMSAQLRRAGIR